MFVQNWLTMRLPEYKALCTLGIYQLMPYFKLDINIDKVSEY